MTLEELLADVPIAPPTLTGAVGKPANCRRHIWLREVVDGVTTIRCQRCTKPKDEGRSRQGKNNRKRGNSLELWFCRSLGLEKIGQLGLEADGRTPEGVAGNAMFVAQVKSGQQFPGWMQRILDTLPRTGGRVPILGIVSTPGGGQKRRAVVVMDLDDFRDLHGPVGPSEP